MWNHILFFFCRYSAGRSGADVLLTTAMFVGGSVAFVLVILFLVGANLIIHSIKHCL